MSVIAYKDGVMAADSRAWGGKYSCSPGTKAKAHRLEDGTRVGIVSAVVGMPERFVAWLKAGSDPKEWGGDPRPDLKAMIVRPNGEVYLAEDDVWFSGPIKTTCHAIGSGGEYALGAMYAGLSAPEAVRIACQLDVNCGEPVLVLEA